MYTQTVVITKYSPTWWSGVSYPTNGFVVARCRQSRLYCYSATSSYQSRLFPYILFKTILTIIIPGVNNLYNECEGCSSLDWVNLSSTSALPFCKRIMPLLLSIKLNKIAINGTVAASPQIIIFHYTWLQFGLQWCMNLCVLKPELTSSCSMTPQPSTSSQSPWKRTSISKEGCVKGK